jgi:hypothetical protein
LNSSLLGAGITGMPHHTCKFRFYLKMKIELNRHKFGQEEADNMFV